MTVDEAQADLRRSYTDGGPGTVISGLVWLATSWMLARSGVQTGFAVLFFGGMLIFPLALLVNRALLKRSKEAADNPFGMLVLEVTIAMIAMLFAAWLILPHDPALVFPLSAIAVGVHYFAFKTAYGMRAYWLLGAAITLVGLVAIYRFAPLPGGVALWVGMIEVIFGLVLTVLGLRPDAR